MWTNFIYERVTISYIKSFHVDPAALERSDPVLLDDDEVSNEPEKPKPTKEDFSLYNRSTAEIVTVHWRNRKCSGT